MEIAHADFLELRDKEKIALGVDRLRLNRFYTSPFVMARLKYHQQHRH